MFEKIKSKFIVLVVVIVIIGMGFPTFFLLGQLKDNFQQRSFAMLDITLDVLTSSIVSCLGGGGNSNVQKIITNMAENRNIDHIRILNLQGKILHSSKPDEKGKQIEKVDIAHSDILKNRMINNDDIEVKENGYYVAFHTIKNAKKCQSCHESDKKILAYFDVDTKLTTAEKYFYTGAFHTIFLEFAIVILIILGVYFSYSELINKPLKKVINGLDEVGDGNLNITLEVENNDEFGIINNHFNTMVKSMKTAKEKIEELSFSELEHTDKLATIGQLTAEISHEINNPTAIIMSRADYLIMESDDNPALKKYSEDFDAIYSQTEKISAITKNVLKYSRKLPQKFVKVDLKEPIKNALNILKLKIQKKGIVVSENYSGQTFVLGNAIQLEQVVINILHNAIDSLQPKGKIGIKITDDDKKILLSLSDNGHGMDEETKAKIFAPFFTTKPENVGTGLGMFIIEKICKNHKAKITFESELNIGTTFNIHFNRYEETV